MAFRFMDLPPELRNLVYSFVYHSSAPNPTIDIFKTHHHIPPIAITHVNKQLHHETLSLFHSATTAFWSSHELSVSIDCTSTSRRRRRDDILHELLQLERESGKRMVIDKLTLKAKFVDVGEWIGEARIRARIEMESATATAAATVKWSCECGDSVAAADAVVAELEEWSVIQRGTMIRTRKGNGGEVVVSLEVSKCIALLLYIF